MSDTENISTLDCRQITSGISHITSHKYNDSYSRSQRRQVLLPPISGTAGRNSTTHVDLPKFVICQNKKTDFRKTLSQDARHFIPGTELQE